jgi:hypothetical protein
MAEHQGVECDVEWRGIRALQGAAATFPQAACSLIALDMPPALELPAGIVLHRALDWLLNGATKVATF